MAPTHAHPGWIWDKAEYTTLKPPLEPPSEDSLLGPASVSSSLSTTSSSSSSSSSLSSSSSSSSSSSTTAEPPPPPAPTIRFPPREGPPPLRTSVSDYVCRWHDCQAKFTSSSSLIEHLQVKHVNTQTLGEVYVCLWTSCKVYERESCSRTWLERHVLSHGGNKPYRCIVDGCGHRFSSQNMLQRHVNGHFGDGSSSSNGGRGRLSDGSGNGSSKDARLIRRNGKRLRLRRHPFSARVYDFFDAGIMEGVQHSLIELTERRTAGRLDSPDGHTITLHAKVMGKRIEPNGQSKVLLRWFPPNIVDDEWVDETGALERRREVRIPSLPPQSKEHIYNLLSSNVLSRRIAAKHPVRRKPPPPT